MIAMYLERLRTRALKSLEGFLMYVFIRLASLGGVRTLWACRCHPYIESLPTL